MSGCVCAEGLVWLLGSDSFPHCFSSDGDKGLGSFLVSIRENPPSLEGSSLISYGLWKRQAELKHHVLRQISGLLSHSIQLAVGRGTQTSGEHWHFTSSMVLIGLFVSLWLVFSCLHSGFNSTVTLLGQKEPVFGQFIFELFGCKVLQKCEVVLT